LRERPGVGKMTVADRLVVLLREVLAGEPKRAFAGRHIDEEER
jgi:hypothetical protein